ncbi:MAG: AMP-binding protein, partial [Candidatus Aminicenantes bacterium]
MKEKLDTNEIEDITALTPLQEGIFFHYLKDRERDHYFEQLCLGITGDIDTVSFRKAWNFVVEANEMLRTVFRWEQLDQPTQVILKKHEVEIITYDFSDKGYCSEEQERLIAEVKFTDRKRKFNLTEVPFRILLFKIQPGKYEMIISNHHIVYDGWSNGIILKEFLEFYNDLKNGIQPVKPVKKKFKEFVKWSKSRDTGKEKKFWKEYLEGFTNKTELPIKKRKERSVKEIEDYPIKIGAVLKNKLETYSKSRKVTLSSILYTAWGLLLQKYTNDNDVIFGTTVSGRTAKIKGIDKIVGLFINTLPLRIKTNIREKIGQVVKRTSIHLQKREDFGHTSLTTIKDCSELENKDEFFDSLLVVDNYPLNELFLQNNSSLAIHKYSIFEMSHYDLTVSITLSGEIKIRFIYNNGILDREHLMYLSGHFSRMLESITDNPGVRISDVSILTKKEKELILIDFNSTDACYPKDKKINQLFEEQAAKSKIRDNIVIVFNDEMISYKELDERCNQLAEMLVEKGIRSGDIVGLLKERSLDLIIGIIGILKINGICLPLDVTYPGKRKSALLENSGAGFAIKGKECDYISNANCRVIDFDNQGIASYSKSKHVRKTADSEEGAFIFYTSGSTGKPKGIIITHTGTINNIYSKIKEMDLCRDDIFCQCLNISFAASVWQIFAPLVLASKFHIYPKAVIMDSYELFRRVDNDSITVLEVVPSMLNSYLELLKEKIKPPLNQLRVLLLTGEKIEPSLVNKFFKNYNLRLLNAYGQTEYTDDALYYEIPYNLETRIVPVGKPAINTQVYILDKDYCLQPLGIPGELFAAGDGLAKGYINDVETTSEKFTENLFNPGKKMYKTGDLARW